jgi:hypothetical protein
MQTLEAARPPLLSASYSAEDSLKGTPQIYGAPQEYLASDVSSPYNANEKGIEDQSPRPRRFNPYPKFSRQWWRTAWDNSVKDGKGRRIAYCSFGVILIMIWTVVMLEFANAVVKSERANLAGTLSKHGTTKVPGEVRNASLRMYSGLTIHRSLCRVSYDNLTRMHACSVSLCSLSSCPSLNHSVQLSNGRSSLSARTIKLMCPWARPVRLHIHLTFTATSKQFQKLAHPLFPMSPSIPATGTVLITLPKSPLLFSVNTTGTVLIPILISRRL